MFTMWTHFFQETPGEKKARKEARDGQHQKAIFCLL